MKKIAILGAGGFGREVLQLIKDINNVEPAWEILGFFDDNKDMVGGTLNGYNIIGSLDALAEMENNHICIVCAVGSPKAKEKVIRKVSKLNNTLKYATLIHPTAVIGESVKIKEGSIICAGTVMMTDITIGKHVIINKLCSIGHDANVEDYCTVAPGATIAGYVNVDRKADIGTRSAIIQGINVGSNAVVGAGAVVTKDLPSNCTAVGVPAKPIKYHE